MLFEYLFGTSLFFTFFIVIFVVIIFSIILFFIYNSLQNRINYLQIQIKNLRNYIESSLVKKESSNSAINSSTAQIQPKALNSTQPIETNAVNQQNTVKTSHYNSPLYTPNNISSQPRPASSFKPNNQHSLNNLPPFERTASSNFLDSRFMQWLIKGNPVAKVAIIILFFGLSYLFKFSIDNGLLSPEIRILGALTLGVILLLCGWKLRHKKELYGLILQGGSIGILYITLFAAFKLYELTPLLLTFALLLIVCATSIVFAILQRAISLAIIACVGGYLAPILLSTGSGNHIALFSYYLLISSAILVISFWQSWRLLNLIGFVFTFVISIAWGYSNYKSDFYVECQLFILANLIIYGILAVVLSIRNKTQEPLQTLYDRVLLFSVPLIAFAMQYYITKQWEYAPAFSALGFGLIYLLGSFAVLKQWQGQAKQLALYGLAIGLGFSTLAVPLALTVNWTALVWLFEGTALTYIALHLRQRYFSYFGTLVVMLGVICSEYSSDMQYLDNTAFITGFFVLSALMLFNACIWFKYNNSDSLAVILQITYLILAFIACSQLIILGTNRITAFNGVAHHVVLACFTIAVWIWYSLGRQLNWQLLRLSIIALWPILFLSFLYNMAFYSHSLTSILGTISWLGAFVSAYFFLYTSKDDLNINKNLSPILHISLFWLVLGWITYEISGMLHYLPWGFSVVNSSIYMAIASLAILIILFLAQKNVFPVKQLPVSYIQIALLPVSAYLLLKLLIESTSSAQILHWYYVPLLNPLEISAIFAIMMLYAWEHMAIKYLDNRIASKKQLHIGFNLFMSFILFLWGNSILMRCLSEWLNISWSAYSLWHSISVQVAISLTWTTVALLCIAVAHKFTLRYLWFVGAILQSIVVLKLIFIDSVALEGLTRAFVFIGVALLMLVIGYLAPIPPKQSNKKMTTEMDKQNNKTELEK
ncbi:DUF2339 domain-containing protein [Orbaceae bacterium ac157xtp]